jgi:hypothetical protein
MAFKLIGCPRPRALGPHRHGRGRATPGSGWSYPTDEQHRCNGSLSVGGLDPESASDLPRLPGVTAPCGGTVIFVLTNRVSHQDRA